MILSTLCYIEKNNKYLMLHRTKEDINKGKWLGIGGKFEKNESPEECIIREAKEETGLNLKSIRLRCIVTYISTNSETEYIYVFTCDDFDGELIECNEGKLEWVEKNKVLHLDIWEGDKYFLEKINNRANFFTIKFEYSGEKLLNYIINQY